MSYTKFKYSGLSVRKLQTQGGDDNDASAWDSGEASPNVEGGSAAAWCVDFLFPSPLTCTNAYLSHNRLHRPAYQVSFNITNTGGVYGAESPQLYINFPQSSGEPPAVLRGFDSVVVSPGKSAKVTMNLSRYDLSIWDVQKRGWRRPKGSIGVTVGASSRDKKLRATLPG
jgi:beta-glucosidase